jgi:hypothetical protein
MNVCGCVCVCMSVCMGVRECALVCVHVGTHLNVCALGGTGAGELCSASQGGPVPVEGGGGGS